MTNVDVLLNLTNNWQRLKMREAVWKRRKSNEFRIFSYNKDTVTVKGHHECYNNKDTRLFHMLSHITLAVLLISLDRVRSFVGIRV